MANVDGLNADFKSRLLALINASKGQISIQSGYRSIQEQQALWDAAVAKYGSAAEARKWVAPPGQSHHNEGIAADLGGNLALAHQLAPLYGLYFPMPWEKWHVEPVGSQASSKSMTTVPDWYQQVAKANGSTTDQLGAVDKQASIGALHSILDPEKGIDSSTMDSFTSALSNMVSGNTSSTPGSASATGPSAISAGGDTNAQLIQGFKEAGRPDLAAMVGTPAWNKWVGAESGGRPDAVSPANNQGKPNGGIMQFWAGHDWAAPYFKGGKFTMTPHDQAVAAAKNFNLTPQKINNYAQQVQAGTYKGWG